MALEIWIAVFFGAAGIGAAKEFVKEPTYQMGTAAIVLLVASALFLANSFELLPKS